MSENAVFIRLDKIGDLVATLPVDQAEFLQNQQITWVIDSSVQFLAQNAMPVRESFPLSLRKKWDSFQKLLQFLKTKKPARVVIFYAPWWASLAALMAQVPLRIGRKSQWHSLVFLNKTLRQSRSQSLQHEAEYNWELLHFAYDQKPTTSVPVLKLQPKSNRQLFEKFNLQPKSYVVVHPGMAGSALNWPQKNFSELIGKLVEKTTVVVTGTNADSRWLNEIEDRWNHHPRVRFLKGQLQIEQLLFILQNATSVAAPSTGVLHLAASTGTPVVGIYSPVRAHHPNRWGPRGFGASFVLPDDVDPETIQDLEKENPLHPRLQELMARISVETVLEKMKF